MADTPQEPSSDRRGFFRRLLLRGLDEVEQKARAASQRMAQAMRDAGVPEGEFEGAEARRDGSYEPRPLALPEPAETPAGSAGGEMTAPRRLRPPGALPGQAFHQTCSRGGECVRVCPVQAIVQDFNHEAGLPYILARQSPCVVCADLACMRQCPSGALQLVARPGDIRMGLAEVDFERCLRGLRGEDCRVCVDICPFGAEALAVGDDFRLRVGPACTGCGRCEQACPTDPASIWVNPA